VASSLSIAAGPVPPLIALPDSGIWVEWKKHQH
jgi:hypothetical protein